MAELNDELKQALTIGREYYHNREYAKAEPYLAKVAAEGKKFADVWNMLGVIYHDQGQFTKAQKSFEEALQINPRYTEASLNLAVTYNDLGKYVDAKETYRKALTASAEPPGELDPFVKGKVANMYADIGDVYGSSGCFRAAVQEYERALHLRPGFLDIRLKLANAFRDLGDKAQAVEQLRTILQLSPEHVAARISLSIALYSAGEVEAALVELERVLLKEPGHSRAALYKNMILDRVRAAGEEATVPAGHTPPPKSP
jgi:tetratricopeptide (TPR) repeat protein